MRKFLIFFTLIFLTASSYAFEIDTSSVPDKVKIPEQKKELKGSLFVTETQEAQIIINKQQEKDVQDLETIWVATVDKNPIIKFTLEKLAIPEEQRRVHSSLMAKSMSAIISGASILPSFLGMNYAVQSASYASARLVHNLINKKNNDILTNAPLTDTEAIELANLIEDLQDEIVVAYYGYKNTLLRLKEVKAQELIKYKNYQDAVKNDDKLESTIAFADWQSKMLEETELKQEARKYYLMLQRLSGNEAIDKLNLIVYDLKTQGVEIEDLNFDKKIIAPESEVQK